MAKKAVPSTPDDVVETETGTEEVDEATVESTTEATPAEDAEEVSGDSVVVAWNGGERTYSKEAHGKNFRKLAAEFAEKKGGKLI